MAQGDQIDPHILQGKKSPNCRSQCHWPRQAPPPPNLHGTFGSLHFSHSSATPTALVKPTPASTSAISSTAGPTLPNATTAGLRYGIRPPITFLLKDPTSNGVFGHVSQPATVPSIISSPIPLAPSPLSLSQAAAQLSVNSHPPPYVSSPPTQLNHPPPTSPW